MSFEAKLAIVGWFTAFLEMVCALYWQKKARHAEFWKTQYGERIDALLDRLYSEEPKP